ncbi:hypothetical protein SCAR479_09200 [Seiridium cardinale]|uniref:Uncharacterized protein n=1 Tax=Seiridium cardinale TaxID=138064 RepID=A0ABR2XKD0_9PEZI
MPDYGQSCGKTYIETTLALLEAGDCSTHLLAAGIGWDNNQVDMPTWAVDWARPPDIFDRDNIDGRKALDGYWAGITNTPDKTDNSVFTIIDHDKILGKFIQLDEIIFLSPPIRPDTSCWFLDCWDSICLHLPEGSRYGMPSLFPMGSYEALWRVLLDVPTAGRPKKHNCNDGSCQVETDYFSSGFVESNGEQHLGRNLVDKHLGHGQVSLLPTHEGGTS